jgi:hypothetical protein
MAQKATENSILETPRDPRVEAVLRGTHEDAERSAHAVEIEREEIRKNEALKKAEESKKHDAEFEMTATETNGLPIPASVLLQASKAASEFLRENLDMKEIVVEEKRLGLTSWIKSKPPTTSRDGKTVTYTYTYVKRDYTDALVVGLVMVFVLTVVLIELMQKLVEVYVPSHP